MKSPVRISSLEEYHEHYQKSVNDPEKFWGDIAATFLWRKPWEKVLEWDFKNPSVKWFQGGQLNITENCLDRHLETMGNKPAIIWESNDPEEHHRVLT